jgi:hypothetical protein
LVSLCEFPCFGEVVSPPASHTNHHF